MPDWDARYAAGDDVFGSAPNEYVRRIATHPAFPGGPVLCLADGDGRNGTWLAGRGLKVTAVDISAVATQKALKRDDAAGVRVERHTADLAIWSPAAGARWASAFLIYLQSDPATRRRAIRLAADHLEPGGWLVIEAFAGSRGGSPVGPSDEAVRYRLGEILELTPDLEALEALEGTVLLDEGERHRGAAGIVRYTGSKT